MAECDVGARKLPFLALDISGLHSNFKIISNKVRIKIHMRQVSGLGIWRRVECRALQRYGGNNIKVQSAPLSVFPVFNLGGRCSDV